MEIAVLSGFLICLPLKLFLCILLKTSAQCGFATMCFISCLQFLTGRKAAFYRCISDGELIGTVAAFAGNSLPDGWLLCNGSAVSRTAYATLFSVIGTMYGTGDGSTTFALPNLIDKFVEGSTTAGTVKSAGLPNITGYTGPLRFMSGMTTNNFGGALYLGGGSSASAASIDGMNPGNEIRINASRSNSIYGNSTTVQPPALTMCFAIYSGVVSKKLWLRTI